jgi:hypothetical protein
MRKRTMRRLPQLARRLAELENEAASLKRKLHNLIPLAIEADLARTAIGNMTKADADR